MRKSSSVLFKASSIALLPTDCSPKLIGAAQIQCLLYSDLQVILDEDYKAIEGNLADLIPLDRPTPFIVEGEVQAPGTSKEGQTSKDTSLE